MRSVRRFAFATRRAQDAPSPSTFRGIVRHDRYYRSRGRRNASEAASLRVPMLREFLVDNREAIVARARAKAGVRSAPRVTEAELASGIPLFLEQLIQTLKVASTAGHAIGDSAGRHGGDLLSRGFTIAQVVHDYGNVCQAALPSRTRRLPDVRFDEFERSNCAPTTPSRGRHRVLAPT